MNINWGKILCLSILLLTLALYPLLGEEEAEVVTDQLDAGEEIIVDEEIIEAEIIIRVPETSILPRTKTEQIEFTLNYLRQLIIESNKHLY